MKQARKQLTYANVMSSIAVFLVLGGATAFAATQLGKNSVGTKQLKRNAVTAAKIKKNAVTGSKVKNGSLTGADIAVGTLGTVPSAASLAGQTPFSIRLGFGQSQTIATNEAVSFIANCFQEAGRDAVRIVAATTVNGAILIGNDEFAGESPTEFLNVATPIEDRELVEADQTSGKTRVTDDFLRGFVLGPEGKMLTTNSEGIALGLNYGQPGCLVAGVINAVG